MPKVLVDLDALRKVIDYLWDTEQKHYEETVSSEAPDSSAVRGHIFRTLKNLDAALPESEEGGRRRCPKQSRK